MTLIPWLIINVAWYFLLDIAVDITALMLQSAISPAFCETPPTDDDKFIYDPNFGNDVSREVIR